MDYMACKSILLSRTIFIIQNKKKSIYYSALATIIALSFTTWKEILAAEDGRVAKIETLNIGYWLWVIALTILTIGTIYYFISEIHNTKSSE